MWYFIIICTPFFSKLNGKIMKMYVIDNKLLEVYCQVIVSIWVILYRCTWSYKNNGQLKHSQIECQLLWTLNDISPCCMNNATGCDVYGPRYISSNVLSNIWHYSEWHCPAMKGHFGTHFEPPLCTMWHELAQQYIFSKLRAPGGSVNSWSLDSNAQGKLDSLAWFALSAHLPYSFYT
jgi:hypothetical protein